MDVVDLFNTKLKEFLKDVIPLCPDLEDARKALNLALAVDRTIALTFFNQYVAQKYTHQISNKDEAFFLTKSYDNENIKMDFDFIEKLKEIWSILNDNNKDAIWRYMQVLLLLNSKYYKHQMT